MKEMMIRVDLVLHQALVLLFLSLFNVAKMKDPLE